MRALVTGATGFLGNCLTLEPRRRGWEIDLSKSSAHLEYPRQVELKSGLVEYLTAAGAGTTRPVWWNRR